MPFFGWANSGPNQGKKNMTTKAKKIDTGSEANGWTPAALVHQEGFKHGGCPLRVVIYRRIKDYGVGTHAAVKVVGKDSGAAAGALLRLAAAAEELGQQVNIARDRVGNRTFWIEDENVEAQLSGLVELAAKEGWL